MSLRFHRLGQKDLQAVLQYYEDAGGPSLADRFFSDLEALIFEIAGEPTKFHFAAHDLRRANMARFPYHLLYCASPAGVRILVLRHHKRHPTFGAHRK